MHRNASNKELYKGQRDNFAYMYKEGFIQERGDNIIQKDHEELMNAGKYELKYNYECNHYFSITAVDQGRLSMSMNSFEKMSKEILVIQNEIFGKEKNARGQEDLYAAPAIQNFQNESQLLDSNDLREGKYIGVRNILNPTLKTSQTASLDVPKSQIASGSLLSDSSSLVDSGFINNQPSRYNQTDQMESYNISIRESVGSQIERRAPQKTQQTVSLDAPVSKLPSESSLSVQDAPVDSHFNSTQPNQYNKTDSMVSSNSSIRQSVGKQIERKGFFQPTQRASWVVTDNKQQPQHIESIIPISEEYNSFKIHQSQSTIKTIQKMRRWEELSTQRVGSLSLQFKDIVHPWESQDNQSNQYSEIYLPHIEDIQQQAMPVNRIIDERMQHIRSSNKEQEIPLKVNEFDAQHSMNDQMVSDSETIEVGTQKWHTPVKIRQLIQIGINISILEQIIGISREAVDQVGQSQNMQARRNQLQKPLLLLEYAQTKLGDERILQELQKEGDYICQSSSNKQTFYQFVMMGYLFRLFLTQTPRDIFIILSDNDFEHLLQTSDKDDGTSKLLLHFLHGCLYLLSLRISNKSSQQIIKAIFDIFSSDTLFTIASREYLSTKVRDQLTKMRSSSKYSNQLNGIDINTYYKFNPERGPDEMQKRATSLALALTITELIITKNSLKQNQIYDDYNKQNHHVPPNSGMSIKIIQDGTQYSLILEGAFIQKHNLRLLAL